MVSFSLGKGSFTRVFWCACVPEVPERHCNRGHPGAAWNCNGIGEEDDENANAIKKSRARLSVPALCRRALSRTSRQMRKNERARGGKGAKETHPFTQRHRRTHRMWAARTCSRSGRFAASWSPLLAVRHVSLRNPRGASAPAQTCAPSLHCTTVCSTYRDKFFTLSWPIALLGDQPSCTMFQHLGSSHGLCISQRSVGLTLSIK